MADLITRTAKLVPYTKRPKQMPGFVTAYTYEPQADEPAAAYGSLFLVFEALVSGRTGEDLADLIIQSAGDHYFNAADPAATAMVRFEHAIKAVNRELTEYVNRGNAAWIGKLSAVIAVQVGEELHVAHTGSADAYLYRGANAVRITTPHDGKPTPPSKTFGSLVSGSLTTGDKLLLATPALIHQLSLPSLKTVVSGHTPSAAIAEITQLLRAGSTDRIAALVIELTTPERAALQVRGAEPGEIQLGTPENALQAARLATSPVASAAQSSATKAVASTRDGLNRVRPHVRRAGYAAADALRRSTTHHSGRVAIVIGLLLVLGAGGAGVYLVADKGATAPLVARYDTDYKRYAAAEAAGATGRDQLQLVADDLAKLDAGARKRIDSSLAMRTLERDQPSTVGALETATNAAIERVDKITSVQPTDIGSIGAIKTGTLVVTDDKAYAVPAESGKDIAVVDLTTKRVSSLPGTGSKTGEIAAIALAGDRSGIYIASSTSKVWFYDFEDGTTTELSASGGWPKATSLSAYAGNLYILSEGTVYRHVRTYAGFGPKTPVLTADAAPELKDTTSLAVDGNIYLAGKNGLARYLAGSLVASSPLPGGAGGLAGLQLSASGASISAVTTSGRIASWADDDALTFERQIKLGDKATGAVVAADGTTIYAVSGTRFVSFTNPK